MKTTFLIYKDINAEKKELVVATHDEWNAIMQSNKGLAVEDRRHFILDCIEDDRMYIEVSIKEYKVWSSKHKREERIRKEGMKYKYLPMNEIIEVSDSLTCEDCISDEIDYAGLALKGVAMEELKAALDKWEPYGHTLLQLYLSGNKRRCTKELSETIGVSEQYVRRKKKEFEKLVKSFLIF